MSSGIVDNSLSFRFNWTKFGKERKKSFEMDCMLHENKCSTVKSFIISNGLLCSWLNQLFDKLRSLRFSNFDNLMSN